MYKGKYNGKCVKANKLTVYAKVVWGIADGEKYSDYRK